MLQLSVTTYPEIEDIFDNAGWYKALTLTERLASLKTNPSRVPVSNPFDTEKAGRRLRRWKAQNPFQDEAKFSQRLASQQISLGDFYAILGETPEAIKARLSAAPPWLAKLEGIFVSHSKRPQLPVILAAQASGPEKDGVSLLNAFAPLLTEYLEQLQGKADEFVQRYGVQPFDPATVGNLLLPGLAQSMLSRLSRTIALELNVARLEGRLVGSSPAERYADFMAQLGQPERLASFLLEYPVLARQLVILLDNWLNYMLEFLEHLCADWEQICACFCGQSEPGKLVEVNSGAGDVHRGGRSVLTLKFSSGFRLVYKPRSLSIDLHFQELLKWLNQRGAHPSFRTLTLLDRGSYGWSEFVMAEGCHTLEELERFYERQGGYLALLYALEATDVHYENLIAAGEHPVLIDLEALFHPRLKGFYATQSSDPAAEQIGHSVVRVGLLPQRIWSNEASEGIDLSGLNGKPGQLTPAPVANWQGLGTDQMQLVRERVPIPGSLNRPNLNGNVVEAAEYIAPLMRGFSRMYNLLIECREEFLAGPQAAFAQDNIRLIVRASNTYARLLQESFHPDLLRDALDRDRFFDNLWVAEERQPALAQLIPSELADLFNGDIPMFTSAAASLDVSGSQGEVIAEFLDTCGLELARQRLRALSEQDRVRQLWFIEAAFASVDDNPAPIRFKGVVSKKPEYTADIRKCALAEAKAIGNRLAQLAISDQGKVNWVGLNMMKERDWRIMPGGLDLYNGLPGIIFFLAYLGHIGGQKEYTELAKAAFETLNHNVEPAKAHFKWIGGFEGSGSLVYLYSHLGQLWFEPEIFRQAEEIVEYMPEFIVQDEAFDLVGGSAGCILGLLSLYQVAPSEATLKVAIQAGEHLLACARAMPVGIGWATHLSREIALAGLGHGNAGIALSLFKLHAVTGDERFYHTAQQALAYERSLFSVQRQNWPNLLKLECSDKSEGRNNKGRNEHQFMTAWCHGATGIGLSRLAISNYINNATIQAEIDAAVKTTLTQGFGQNHSLCHGAFGSLELLLTASRIEPQYGYLPALVRSSAGVLDKINKYGWLCGTPSSLETPGLMLGLAGIGYGCLRLAEADYVPGLLLLEPPSFTV